jgi:ribosome-binding ATPase YchF (GTP1/OBG family)
MIIGLVGKPSSGKSSFFKSATMIDVKITGIPFTTIEPNVGIGYVIVDCVCKELNVKCNPKVGYCKNGKRFIPIRLIDVGGLIPGSHLGKGIGNKFLDDLRQASVLIQVIDASGLTDSEGKPTANYDPNTEIQFLENEIDLWFADVIKRAVQKIGKNVSSRDDLIQAIHQQLSGLEIKKEDIINALEKSSINDIENFARTIRKISKPIIIAANKIDLKSSQENFEKLKQKYQFIVPTSAEAEITLKKAAERNFIDYLPGNGFEIKGNLDEKQRNALEFIKREIIEKFGSTGIQQCLNKAVFEFLNYIVVYPVEDENKFTDKDGNILPDAYLLPKNSTALDLAFKIHTDIGKKFVSAIDVRTKRRLAKEYQLKNNDVIKIHTAK